MNRMHHTDDIVCKHFQECFVLLCHFRLAADEISELAFHRRERRFHVAAFVIVSEKFFALEIVEVEQAVPMRALSDSA